MKVENTTTSEQTSLLNEIFIQPSNTQLNNRFDESKVANAVCGSAGCGCGCGGGCGGCGR